MLSEQVKESPVAAALEAFDSSAMEDGITYLGQLTLYIKPSSIVDVCRYLKNEQKFVRLSGVTALDWLPKEPRFEVVYELYSLTLAIHLRLKLRISEDPGTVDTVSDIWPTANWHEREMFDMMGIKFNGHPDLRRILMWDGYPYYPLRKEFPLEGLPSDMPDVAFTEAAPMEGGPFVTMPSTATTKDREPRARRPEL